MITVRWKSDFTLLAKIDKLSDTAAQDATKEAAESLVNDIRSSWHPTTPAPIGKAPGVRSGALDRSVTAEAQGRTSGMFAGKFGAAHYVRVDRDNAQAIEDTDNIPFGARPYFEPAVQRAAGTFGTTVKVHFDRALKRG